MAQFDRVIPPGGKGSVTLKLNTRGYFGKITKTAKVYTNDPAKKVSKLTISAIVRAPIYQSMKFVYIYGVEGQIQSRIVKIKANRAIPLKLTPVKFTLAGKVDYELEEVEKGKRFRVKFTNKKLPPGSYYGLLKLRTNYKDKPFLSINIRVKVSKKKPVLPVPKVRPKS